MTRSVDQEGFYRSFNSGFFGGIRRTLKHGEHPKLIGIEREIAREIATHMRHSPEPVTVVDVGGKAGGSCAVLTEVFRKAITGGFLRIIVTNKETQPIHKMLDIMRQRIREGRSWNIIADEQTIDYLQSRSHLVNWKNGVSTEQLPALIGSAEIVHEHMGGLRHHANPAEALRAIIQILKPGGKLFTVEAPEFDTARYGPFPDKFMEPDRRNRWSNTYNRYTRK